MRFPKLIIAVVVLIVVGGFFYIHEIRGKKEKAREEKIERLLYNYDPNSINKVELLLKGEKIIIVKKDKGWFISRPIEYPADSQTLERIITALKETKVTSFVEKGKKLQQYNLSPAPLTVTLTTALGEKLPSLWIGDETPLQGEYFAMQEGKKDILILSAEIVSVSEIDLFALREKSMLPFSRWDISEIILESGNRRMRFKNSSGSWDMIEPLEFPADENKVSTILNALENSEVKKFIDDAALSLTEFGFDKPSFKISLKTGSNPDWVTIAFGKEEGGSLYAKRSDRNPLLIVEKTPFVHCISDSKEFMDTRISKRNRYTTKEFAINWGGKTVQVRMNDENEWVLLDSGAVLDKGNIYISLSSLMESRCSDFIKRNEGLEKSCGFAKPLIRMTLKGEDFSEELLFSKDSDGNFYALNSSVKAVIYKISGDDFDRIEASLSRSFQ